MPQDQKIVKDERGQEQPADKKRAQQSAKEGPAAYAPHDKSAEKGEAYPDREPAKKKTGEF